MLHIPKQIENDRAIILETVSLLHEHVVFLSVPPPGPVLVGPGDTERKRRGAACQQPLERTLEQPLSRKPVVVEAESMKTIVAGELDLLVIGLVERRS